VQQVQDVFQVVSVPKPSDGIAHYSFSLFVCEADRATYPNVHACKLIQADSTHAIDHVRFHDTRRAVFIGVQ
jgi:hypothetical protein